MHFLKVRFQKIQNGKELFTVAIYHCSVKIVSRSTGRSSVAAAAYRSGEKLYNEREGIEHDFTRKQGVEHSEIMLPENAPAEYQNRETLWNAVEKSEKRKDAQTAREIEVALPVEFTRQEQIGVLRDYVQQNFTSRGMCADICLHDKGDGNPHAHIMLTTREVTPEGFAGKCREWNDKKNVEEWRQQWAEVCNREFEKKNLPDRLDHRSFERQGKEQLPTIHLGASAAAMERRGEKTERGQYNEEVRAANMEYQDGLEELRQEVMQLKQAQEIAAAQQAQQEKQKQEQEQAEEESRKKEQPDEQQREAADRLRVQEVRQQPRREMPDAAHRPGSDPGEAARSSTGETAEQTAQRLDSLKAEYVRLEVQIEQTQQRAGELRNADRQLQSRAEGIQETAQTVEQYSKRIEQLHAEREKLGLFSGKQKRAIDEQTRRLEQSKAQAQSSLQRECGAAGQGAALEQIQRQQGEIRAQLASLPDTRQLREQQAAIEKSYQAQKAAAMQRPDWERIRELTDRKGKAKEPEKEQFTMRSLKERMAAAKAESQLNGKDKAKPQQRSRGTEGRGR